MLSLVQYKEITAFVKNADVEKMAVKLNKHILNSHENCLYASELLGKSKAFVSAVEKGKLEYTKPHRDLVSEVNTEVKTKLAKLVAANADMSTRIGEYTRQAEIEKEKERLKKLKEEERRAKISKTKGGDGEVKTPVEAVVPLNVELGVKVRKTWKAEIIDETKIPREYLTPDTVKINQAVRSGTREIPGVKIYQDISHSR